MYKGASEHQQARTRTGSQGDRPKLYGIDGAERDAATPLESLEAQHQTLVEQVKAAGRASIIARDRLHTARRRAAAFGTYLPAAEYDRLQHAHEAARLRCAELDHELCVLKPLLKVARVAAHQRDPRDHAAAAFLFLEVARRRLAPATFSTLMDEALMLAAAQRAARCPPAVDEP